MVIPEQGRPSDVCSDSEKSIDRFRAERDVGIADQEHFAVTLWPRAIDRCAVAKVGVRHEENIGIAAKSVRLARVHAVVDNEHLERLLRSRARGANCFAGQRR